MTEETCSCKSKSVSVGIKATASLYIEYMINSSPPLSALMISTYGSSTVSNNKNFLCRTYSDSELVKQRRSRMGDALTGHYSFSTSNLRSRNMHRYNFSSDYQKSRKSKKTRKSISLRLKEFKKFIGFRKKKGN